ncbi:hypothetical protein CHCC20335_2050 [Bacillus paralicheniformis]|nr:hypothetical protein CHCC20335_2050 [Bacillus paralicheniformis]
MHDHDVRQNKIKKGGTIHLMNERKGNAENWRIYRCMNK